jgi:hypothetical protein
VPFSLLNVVGHFLKSKPRGKGCKYPEMNILLTSY